MGFSFDDGRASTFGRDLMNYISSKLPYTGYDVSKDTEALNPKYKHFENVGTRRAEILSKYSTTQNYDYNSSSVGNIASDKRYNEIMYANIQKDKAARIRDYRIIAAFAEVADALDEICDEVINKDDQHNAATIEFRNATLTDEQKEIVVKEFHRYINYFDIENKGWDYFRQLLIEGEIYWEHIIHEKYPEAGILGIVQVPTELIDPVYSNVQNIMVKGFLYQKPKFDPNNPLKQIGIDYIPLDKNQITYIHSNMWNENKTMRLPFIENARRAYRQLSMIEDSIIIYRLVRAPERLVFNVDVGNMPAPKAEAYLKKLIQNYWSSKTFDVTQGGGPTQKFNPQSMLDSFWFAKRAGSEGTSVTNLPAGCLAMDTLVPLLDGRTLNIREIEAELQQGKKVWTYSANPDTGHVAPGLVTWAGVTNKSAEVMKLTFDNGKELICTLDHKFPIIGKGFVEAQDLVIGESMIPFYSKAQKIGKMDYEMVYQNDTKTWEYTHRTVSKYFKERGEHNTAVHCEQYSELEKNVVHHKDFNRFNNHPDNLVYMNVKDHIILHRDSGFEPMKGTLAAKESLERMKVENPEAYAEYCKSISDRSKAMWANRSEEEIQAIAAKQSAGISDYINGLDDAARADRAEICRANRRKGNDALRNRLNTDLEFAAQFSENRRKAIKAYYDALSAEERAELFNTKREKLRSNVNYQKHNKYRTENQTLVFDKEIVTFVIDHIKGKTTHEVTKEDLANLINNTPEILNHFLELNKDKNIRNWCGTKFATTHFASMVKQFGYTTWLQFREECDLFNHRLVKVERLADPIEVGTLTIDNDEKYHNYHTFALDCGVFTKNSNLGTLDDLMYFMKKLYKAMKVPVTRLDPQDAFRDGTDILREELKFARFIIRLQQNFSMGLKNGFITHLQLKQLWNKFDLKDQNIEISFNVPTNFYELRENQKLELKVNNYNSLASSEYVSPTYSQKKYLGWSDIDVKANREYLRKDKGFRWELAQIEASGPDWKEVMAAQGGAMGGAPPEGGMGMGGGGGGGGMPPPFTGGAAVTEPGTPPEGAVPPPEGGEAAAPAGGASPAPAGPVV